MKASSCGDTGLKARVARRLQLAQRRGQGQGLGLGLGLVSTLDRDG